MVYFHLNGMILTCSSYWIGVRSVNFNNLGPSLLVQYFNMGYFFFNVEFFNVFNFRIVEICIQWYGSLSRKTMGNTLLKNGFRYHNNSFFSLCIKSECFIVVLKVSVYYDFLI